MKKILVLLLAVTITSCVSMFTYLNSETGKYEEIINYDLSKDQAYDRILTWMAQNYGKANEVIQLKDQENGKIVAKGIGSFSIGLSSLEFYYTLTSISKDSKTKLTFVTGQLYNSVYGVHEDYKNDVFNYYKNLVNHISSVLQDSTKNEYDF